jgi:hypothetical protein
MIYIDLWERHPGTSEYGQAIAAERGFDAETLLPHKICRAHGLELSERPIVGDRIQHDGATYQVEAVTWARSRGNLEYECVVIARYAGAEQIFG